ncbi:hypothetical protein [Bacillus pseudomycoides]|uniref:hypothetical protein n=1 Tax=Bacillus pseudomycoides TaxID=64104 RepID=UPI0028526A0A|nr:hypothetical protein [Bacillus pseudomycoides]MED0855046.1 hypothetical protein [Bacillus pseudomycoides]
MQKFLVGSLSLVLILTCTSLKDKLVDEKQATMNHNEETEEVDLMSILPYEH